MPKDPDKTVTILDYVDQIEVPGDVFARPRNEYWALICLRQGMEFLDRQVAQCDDLVRQRVNPEGELKFVSIGNDPILMGVPKGLLTCSFHWYAVSACQYVRTVGAIAQRNESTRPKTLDYVKQVIPEVLAFRDKVAAHFAWTTKNVKDSDAERSMSVMPPLAFVDDAFHVGALTLVKRSSGKVSDSSAIEQWSITGVHERLRERYWPDPAS